MNSLDSIQFQIFLVPLLRKSLSIFLIWLRNNIRFGRSSFHWIDMIGYFAIWFLSNKNRRQWNIFSNSCHPCTISSNYTALWMISSFSLIIILIMFSCKRWILILFALTSTRTLLSDCLLTNALIIVILKTIYSVYLSKTLFKLIVILVVWEWILLLIVMRFILVISMILLVF